MILFMPVFIALFAIVPLWVEPKIGGDIPPRSTEEIPHSPMPVEALATQHPVTPLSPWDSFVGDFRIGIEQAPIQSFQKGTYEWVVMTDEPDYAKFNGRTQHRPPFLLTLTPFEPFGKNSTPSTSAWESFLNLLSTSSIKFCSLSIALA